MAPPAGRPVAHIDIDGVSVRGRTRDVPVAGLGRTSLDDWIRAINDAQGRTAVPEAFPEAGAYDRSGLASLGRAGVPAVSVEAGTDC